MLHRARASINHSEAAGPATQERDAVARVHEPSHQHTQGLAPQTPWTGNQSRLRRLAVQPKISIGSVHDPLETEADRAADQVMRSLAGEAGPHSGPFAVARKGSDCKEEENKLNPKTSNPALPAAGEAPSIVHDVLNSPGQPLDPASRSFFEPRFGRDFSGVRVHTGRDVERAAVEIRARAFTAGSDIFFASGEYAPESKTGRRLLGHELAHVLQQQGATFPPNHVQRKPAGSNQLPEPPSKAAIDALWTDLHGFVDVGNRALAGVDARIKAYMENYDAAYDEVMKRLSNAKKEEMKREKWKLALEFVVVVGIGLAGGELFEAGGALLHEAVELLPEAVSESAGEVAKKAGEVGVMKGIEPSESEVDFGLPAEVNNDRLARGYFDQLIKGWRGMAEIAQAVLHFDTWARDAERGSAALTGKDIVRLRRRFTDAQGKLTRFVTTADTPVLERSQRQIEVDLWIRWMSQSEANAGAAGADEEIAEHVKEIGVYYDMVGGSDAFREAKLQVERLNQLGRVGVVVVPPFWSMNRSHPLPGVVHVRPEAYRAAGRLEPPQQGATPYVQIEWQEGSHLLTGDVVILAGTVTDVSPRLAYLFNETERAGGLLPKRVGPTLPVSESERAEGLKFLGIDAAAYPRVGTHVVGQDTDIVMSPDRARPLVFQVRQAAENMHAKPPLVVAESEEGVMVSEANGKQLVLFTVYTSWGEARAAQPRTGVPRVVAVELHPSNTFRDFSGQGVFVTTHPDYDLEILIARSGKQADILDPIIHP